MLQISSRQLPFFFLCFTTIALFSNEVELSSSKICQNGKKHYRVSVRHIEEGGIGYSEGYTTLEGFFAPDPQELVLMPFLDVRGHVFNDGKLAANAGLGFRGILGCRTYGVNAYYDYRNTKKLHYNQVGVGLETLGILLDFRINGYLPVGKKVTSPYDITFDGFSGNQLILSQKRQYAMKGADAEMGFHFGKTQNFDFYAATGPYYYIGDIGPNTWGGKARVAGMFKEYITAELSNSYDSMFHNNFQGQLTLTLPFGGKSRVKKTKGCNSCKMDSAIVSRMVQPVGRDEIIVVGKKHQTTPAIDPATGAPYVFVFVDNTSASNGTYESPYHTFAQAEANSSPNDILYVFPGDGTTTGMDSGIALQDGQYFWGSGVDHLLVTSQGTISIPAQSSSSPTITNTNVDTELNAVTLAANNAISGFNITGAMNDAIIGTDPISLSVDSCTFEDTTTFAIATTSSGDASISITNNQFVDNANGIFLTLNGTSSVVCSDNTFTGQTSVSEVPLAISSAENTLTVNIEDNIFDDNETGSIRFALQDVKSIDINVLNNTITNNSTGSQSNLASSLAILSDGTIAQCTIVLEDNLFSGNTSNALYMHTSGTITNLEVTASKNTMSGNGGSALVLATPVDVLTFVATENLITDNLDNGIAVISSGSTSTGNIIINNNIITDIGNSSNGIAINQDFGTLNLTILNNEIDNCEGTGIISYAPSGIESFTLNASGNTISNCQNLSSNAASGLDIEQFLDLAGSVTNNTLSDNTGTFVTISSSLTSSTACLTLTGNDSSAGYTLGNPSGDFNLSPCDVDSVNVGTITPAGTITPVISCPGAVPCS